MNTLDEAGKMGQVCWIKNERSWVVRHIQEDVFTELQWTTFPQIELKRGLVDDII